MNNEQQRRPTLDIFFFIFSFFSFTTTTFACFTETTFQSRNNWTTHFNDSFTGIDNSIGTLFYLKKKKSKNKKSVRLLNKQKKTGSKYNCTKYGFALEKTYFSFKIRVITHVTNQDYYHLMIMIIIGWTIYNLDTKTNQKKTQGQQYIQLCLDLGMVLVCVCVYREWWLHFIHSFMDPVIFIRILYTIFHSMTPNDVNHQFC